MNQDNTQDKFTDDEIRSKWDVRANIILVRLYEPTKAAGDKYVNKDGTVSAIMAPEQFLAKRKFTEEVQGSFGWILAIGRDAYKDARLFPNGARFKVGDFIRFNKQDYSPIKLTDGTVLAELYDNKGTSVINDPSILSQDNFTY